ncbi:MAG: zinc-ribbon domain-containing protein [Ruminococcus sp.]|nr:zinc-ribbon domain-containing protein [Ruminococcus sp.]
MFCPNCGTEMAEGSRFCRSCGAPLDEPAQPQPEQVTDARFEYYPEQEAQAETRTMYAGPQETAAPEQPQTEYAQPVISQPAYEQPAYTQPQTYAQPTYEQPQTYAQPTQPAPTYTTAAAVKGSNVKGRAFLWMVLLFFLCILLFISLLARFLTSKDYFKGVFKDASDQAAQSDAVIDMIEENSTLDHDDIEEILEKTDFSKLLTKYSTRITTFVFEGGKNPKLDPDEIIDAIEDNQKDIEKVIDKRLGDKDWEKIENETYKFTDEFNDNIKDVKRDHSIVFSITSVIGSFWFMWVIIGLMLLILVRLLFLYKKDGSGVYRAFRGYSIVYGIHALILIVVSVVIPSVLSNISGETAGVVAAVIKPMMKAPMYVGFIFLGLCVLCIVLCIVMNVLYNKKRRPA